MGNRVRLNPPQIVMDNPSSFGNYNDTTNTLHTCDWNTLPPNGRAVFDGFAVNMGHGMTGETFLS